MTDETDLLPCGECGMPCRPGEYHPYAACLMFKTCRNSDTVRGNLQDAQDHATAAKDAEIEALRAEVDALRTLVEDATRDRLNAEARAERVAEALREARQMIRDLLPDATFTKWDALLREQEAGR